MSSKALKLITQILLLSVVAAIPFVYAGALYFPFISGKVYVFRLLVMLAFFFWIWLLLKESGIRNKELGILRIDFKNILVIALALFFLAQVLVSFFGVNPLFSLFSSIERGDGVFQYGFWILYFLILISVFKTDRDWKIFFSVFLIAAFLLSVYSWLNAGGQQLSGRFGNPAYFGAYLLFAIGFSLLTFEKKYFYSKWANRALIAAACFFSLTLIFTYIRGAYAGLAGGIFLFCALSFLFLRPARNASHSEAGGKENSEGARQVAPSGLSKKPANWAGIILLAGIVSIALLFAQRESAFVQNREILSRVTQVADFWESASVRERLLNWNIALKAFREKPLFGWGPENYGAAANKYYDFRIGENEPWFDRAHSQPFDILATGGITLFAFYLFWVLAVFFLIWQIAKRQKILSFILASTFLAYLIQGFFLFDTLAVYLGLFPFLAYLVYQSCELRINTNIQRGGEVSVQKEKEKQTTTYKILIPVALFSLFVIYTTVIMPWKANNVGWHFFSLTEQGLYRGTKPYLEKAFSIKSPYTFWELRQMASWQLMNILEAKVTSETEPKKIKEIEELYDFITPELEKCIAARPFYPQTYYVLATLYLLGFEKLGKDDLEKAEAVLRKAFNYSDLRVEYLNQFAKVLLLQGKFDEAEEAIKGRTERMPRQWGEYVPFVTLGNFYFEAEKYQQSLEQYDKAREANFQIQQNEAVYPRYMLAAEKVGNYERIVEMGQKYLERKGPDADTYFNIAIGYWHLGDREKAEEFFLKAVELKPEYEEYQQFFVEK